MTPRFWWKTPENSPAASVGGHARGYARAVNSRYRTGMAAGWMAGVPLLATVRRLLFAFSSLFSLKRINERKIRIHRLKGEVVVFDSDMEATAPPTSPPPKRPRR